MASSIGSIEELCAYIQKNQRQNNVLSEISNELIKDFFNNTDSSGEYFRAYMDCDESNKFDELKIGSIPLATSVGIAHAHLTIQSFLKRTGLSLSTSAFNDNSIKSLRPRIKKVAEDLPSIGRKVLERVSDKPSLLDDLKDAAGHIYRPYAGGQIGFGPGECPDTCVITVFDDEGNVIDRRCGSEEECKGGWIIVVIVVVIAILDWIFDWF